MSDDHYLSVGDGDDDDGGDDDNILLIHMTTNIRNFELTKNPANEKADALGRHKPTNEQTNKTTNKIPIDPYPNPVRSFAEMSTRESLLPRRASKSDPGEEARADPTSAWISVGVNGERDGNN